MRRPGTALLLTGLAVTGLFIGCSAGPGRPSLPSTASTLTVTADPHLHAALPARARATGTLVVAMDPDLPPMGFEGDEGDLQGTDVDLFDAVAAHLGVEADYRYVDFDEIIPGVAAGDYDAGISAISITPERLRRVTMVSYFTSGSWWVVQQGNPARFDPDHPCGHDVSVRRGTTQFEDLAARNHECGRSGGRHLAILATRQQSAATDALLSGHADAMLADGPVALYAATRYPERLELLGEPYDLKPFGIVVAGDQDEFAAAVAAALEKSRENGEYARILRNWGNDRGRIDRFEVHPRL